MPQAIPKHQAAKIADVIKNATKCSEDEVPNALIKNHIDYIRNKVAWPDAYDNMAPGSTAAFMLTNPDPSHYMQTLFSDDVDSAALQGDALSARRDITAIYGLDMSRVQYFTPADFYARCIASEFVPNEILLANNETRSVVGQRVEIDTVEMITPPWKYQTTIEADTIINQIKSSSVTVGYTHGTDVTVSHLIIPMTTKCGDLYMVGVVVRTYMLDLSNTDPAASLTPVQWATLWRETPTIHKAQSVCFFTNMWMRYKQLVSFMPLDVLAETTNADLMWRRKTLAESDMSNEIGYLVPYRPMAERLRVMTDEFNPTALELTVELPRRENLMVLALGSAPNSINRASDEKIALCTVKVGRAIATNGRVEVRARSQNHLTITPLVVTRPSPTDITTIAKSDDVIMSHWQQYLWNNNGYHIPDMLLYGQAVTDGKFRFRHDLISR